MNGCIEWPGKPNQGGYGRRGQQLAHRWTWEQANGPIPDGMIIMHICDNPPCVNIDHLRLATRAENNGDASRKGRNARGRQQPRAKLTEADVLAIRASDLTQSELAVQYGVHQVRISHIKLGRGWTHVKGGE